MHAVLMNGIKRGGLYKPIYMYLDVQVRITSFLFQSILDHQSGKSMG